ncbi:MAG: DUF7882 family protein [Amnibacterium sp.]
MGSISWDGAVVEFDDRLLAHLQIVIVRRFRVGESFLMSWLDPLSEGDGRSADWLTPHCPLHFGFSEVRVPAIDHRWLALLDRAVSSGAGLIVTDADGRPIRATHHGRSRELAFAG